MTPNERHAGMKAAMKAKLKHKGKAPPKKPAGGPAEEMAEPAAANNPKEEVAEAQLIAAMRKK